MTFGIVFFSARISSNLALFVFLFHVSQKNTVEGAFREDVFDNKSSGTENSQFNEGPLELLNFSSEILIKITISAPLISESELAVFASTVSCVFIS